jgi:uncharacterized protein YggT (Ycf19 family)
MRFGKKSSIPSSFKNQGPMSSFECITILIAFAAKYLQFDLSFALAVWFSIRMAINWCNSNIWLSIQRFTNEWTEGMFSFIRSRGRPKRKPPETMKKKSIPLIGIRHFFALVIAIFSIAYYLKASVLRNDQSGNNNSNSFARDRAHEMHQLHALNVYGYYENSTAIANALDSRKDSIDLSSVMSITILPSRAAFGLTDTFSWQSVTNTDIKQTIQSFTNETMQFNPFGVADNQPCSRNNNLFESNTSSLATEQCIRQFGRFIGGSCHATNVVAMAAECERGPSLHDDPVVVLSLDDITIQEASCARSCNIPTNILLSASMTTSVSKGDAISSEISMRLRCIILADTS